MQNSFAEHVFKNFAESAPTAFCEECKKDAPTYVEDGTLYFDEHPGGGYGSDGCSSAHWPV